MDNNKHMVIMRGVPGSGKSTWAKAQYPTYDIISTDNYFTMDGEYKFNKDKIAKAHRWNLEQAAAAVGLNFNVVIDNTNTKIWEMERYIDMGLDNQYKITIITIIPDIKRIDDYFNKNIHGVPKETIKIMINRFSTITAYEDCEVINIPMQF